MLADDPADLLVARGPVPAGRWRPVGRARHVRQRRHPEGLVLVREQRRSPADRRAWSAGWRRVAADEAAAVPPGEAGQRR
jgi:hypothetical protein